MLTYTFSKREKIMLAVLAFVGLAILWYRFVFVNVQTRIGELDTQIGEAQNELLVAQTNATALAQMKSSIEDFEKQGYTPKYLPSYDNTQNLMAYLNGVLGATREYNMSFDEPALGEDDGMVHRTGTISFGSNTYAEARSVVEAIARGPYPCKVEALGITDDTAANAKKGGSSKTIPVTANIQVVFLEKPSSNTTLSKETEDEVKGQDLSQLSNWNK